MADVELEKRLDAYMKWLLAETTRHATGDKTHEQLLDEQLEKWKDDARKANGWKK